MGRLRRATRPNHIVIFEKLTDAVVHSQWNTTQQVLEHMEYLILCEDLRVGVA